MKPSGLHTVLDSALVGLQARGVELKDVAVPIDMQTIFAAEQFQRRSAILGLSNAMVDAACERARAAIFKAQEWCDSPIEKRLLPWLVINDYGDKVLTIPAEVHNPLKQDEKPNGDCVVIPQFRFAKYRMDFAVVTFVGAMRCVCVECDGAEEHTAEHDNPRDAYLRSWGIPTVRATGKEIYANPAVVAARVSDAVRQQVEAA